VFPPTCFAYVGLLIFHYCRKGNGHNFPRNPRSTELLARLAAELAKADKDR
jgi:hypothetical protein